MQNIAVVFIKLGQYSDAVTSYEHIMSEKPLIETCFNLLLCYYALADREKMKKTFQRLVQINNEVEDEEKYNPVSVSKCLAESLFYLQSELQRVSEPGNKVPRNF